MSTWIRRIIPSWNDFFKYVGIVTCILCVFVVVRYTATPETRGVVLLPLHDTVDISNSPKHLILAGFTDSSRRLVEIQLPYGMVIGYPQEQTLLFERIPHPGYISIFKLRLYDATVCRTEIIHLSHDACRDYILKSGGTMADIVRKVESGGLREKTLVNRILLIVEVLVKNPFRTSIKGLTQNLK